MIFKYPERVAKFSESNAVTGFKIVHKFYLNFISFFREEI